MPEGLNTSAVEYLKELRERLKEAEKQARLTSDINQERYANRYKTRSKEKLFEEGDQVLILEHEGQGKLMARGVGPAIVVKRVRPYSYDVELDGHCRRVVHANKLRANNMRG